MDADEFGTRPGEVRAELPTTFDAGLHFIGRLRTPWQARSDCPKNGLQTDAVCTVEVIRPTSRACATSRAART